MSDSTTKDSFGRDVVGIGLFAAGALIVVSAVISWARGTPLVERPGVTVLDTYVLFGLGRPAGFILGAGLATLGTLVWLGGRRIDWVRQGLIGVLFTSLGFSILMGTISPSVGGWLGRSIGWFTSGLATRWVGIPFGLVCAFTPIWFAWLRPWILGGHKPVQERPLRAVGLSESTGVSPEEAAELVPRRRVQGEAPLASLSSRALVTEPDTRPSKPILAGARPYTPTYEPDQKAHSGADPALHRRAAQGTESVQPVGSDLAARPTAAREVQPPVQPLGPAALAGQVALREILPAPEPEAPDLPDPAPASAKTQPLASEPIQRPAWEEAPLFETPDEPVDAYGTPLTLVEKIREDRRADSPAEDVAEIDARSRAAAEQSLETEDEEELEDHDPQLAALGEMEEELDPDVDPISAPGAGRVESSLADAGANDEEVAVAAAGELFEREDDLEDELFSEEARELVGEVLEEEAEPEFELAAPGADAELGEKASDTAEEPAPVVERDSPRSGVSRAAPSSEEDALRREAPLFASHPAEPAASEPEERVVVLQPKPAPRAEERAVVPHPKSTARTAPPPAAPLSPDDLVYKAGLLFLERNRVAVSMLQREFSLDFAQATAMLDKLQAAGLIGPYLGGQRRDILLTLDQWRGRAVSAS